MIVFIYQIVTKPLTSKLIVDEVCPECGKKDDIELTLYMRYIAMGIPILGMGRKTGAVCTNCGNVIKKIDTSIFSKRKYSDNVAVAIKDIRKHKRTLWQLLYPWSLCFVLPIIVLLFMGISSINKSNTKEKAKEYAELLMHPQAGDIYKATWFENGISDGVLVKLLRINGDTLYVVKSKAKIPMSFSKDEWDKLSSEAGAFESKEYKVKTFSILQKTNYGDIFMYNKDKNNKEYPIYLGQVLNSKCEMNLDFETIERKK
jgi:hypothetical protein